ncbi:MAG: homoserine O-succinyltransferase [Lachnospiraceae bacterium]|jgi:homoserine O-succinyltransferase|nr:homoserine O-succinyltransferase [Lachnospiraceae bacterium]
MPIKAQSDLPARTILESENIFLIDETRAISQDIRPLEIAILNLMPLKEETETQLLRALSNTPLQVDITFLAIESHVSKNTSASHLNKFYTTFREVKDRKFDGLIITGAPLEQMDYHEVNYWEELCIIMEWSKKYVTSTLHICWGAQAGLYYHYGIQKYPLKEKLSGIYSHQVIDRTIPMVRGLDDIFFAPHSRYTGIQKEDIIKNDSLTLLVESEEAGPFLIMAQGGKQFFVMGHPEYDRMTLDSEYKRDLKKGLTIQMPKNYYPQDDSEKRPILTWRAHANTLYTNWLDYYVYQVTPYEWV